MKNIYEDKREIKFISHDSENCSWVYEIGKSGVEKILPYQENGEMAPVLWFSVFKNNEIFIRLNGKYVTHVAYK